LAVSFNPRARAGRDWHKKTKRILFWFQSTRPRGARPVLDDELMSRLVSIHAPARGATLESDGIDDLTGFNPRARAGRDKLFSKAVCPLMFQSTRPRGARLRC